MLLLLLACSGSPDDSDADTDTDSDADTDTDTDADSDTDSDSDSDTDADPYTAVIQPIWDAECTRCHDATAPSGDLSLLDGPEDLVEVPSGQSDLLLVAPGDLDASYLWHKLQDTQDDAGGSGVRMPKGGDALASGDMDAVRSWIEGL